jgi:hypothetical protein
MAIAKTPQQISIEEQTAMPADTSLGLLFNPGSLEPVGATLVQGGHAPVYSAGRQALRAFAQTLTAIKEADAAVRTPNGPAHPRELPRGGGAARFQIDPTKVADFGKGLQAAFDRAGAQFEKHRTVVADSLNATASEIAGKLRDPDRNSVSRAAEAAEVRAIVRNAGDKRMGFVADLINQGDIVSTAAILNSPLPTTGLKTAELEVLRSLAEQKFCPELSARREATASVLTTLDSASVEFVKRYKQFVPPPTVATAQTVNSALEKLRTGDKAA